MYKVMLAEDEPEVLRAMIKTIQWEKNGFDTPVPCRDGKEAIDNLQNGFVPHVLITDICMPFVDGLELTKYINQNSPETIVVILTGYDDFKYAQKAIKFQVLDYILKPVTPNQMNDILKRLREELDKRQYSNVESARKIISSYFLNKLITQKMSNDDIEEKCKYHQISHKGRYHIAAVLDVDLPKPVTMEESNSRELMRYGLCNICQEIAEAYAEVVVFQGKDGVANLILSRDTPAEVYSAAMSLTKEVSETTKKWMGISVSGGIGEPVAYLDEIRLSYQQSRAALDYRFFYGESSIICQSDIDVCKSREIDYNICEKQFEEAVREINKKQAFSAIEDLISKLRDGHIRMEKCVLYSEKLMMTLINLIDQLVGDQEVQALEKISEGINFYTIATLSQLEELLMNMCEAAFSILQIVQNDSTVTQVIKAENYIKENIWDSSLSLNSVTEHLAISTSYFSAIFKSKTGSTFVEYVTRLRMEKAKQILALSDKRTYEVADEVGFSDPHYFSVAFKRVTGMTPKEYRESARKHTGKS